MKVHFIGIGGSGISGVASLAQDLGYEVTGCNQEAYTAYTDELKKKNIQIIEGHDPSHIADVDIVAATPSVFFQKQELPEVTEAKNQNKLITWQKFLGDYLQKNKKVIAVAGTHGKSTTSAMLALTLEKAGLDPLAMIGAQVKEWQSNSRVGKGEYFVTEADEFYDNFLNYTPDTIILNNIEFDHPDYFKDENQLFDSFEKFVAKAHVLIYNKDDEGIAKLLPKVTIQTASYSISEVEDLQLGVDKTTFSFRGFDFELKLAGKHNVLNALGVITFALINQIPLATVAFVFSTFDGIGRRLELLGEKNGVLIYDDYAHHPTAIAATIEAIKQKYPNKKLIAIVEPHTFSRTKAVLPLYASAFNKADEVIIAPIYKSRDTEDFGVSGESIVAVSENKNIQFIDDFSKIVEHIKQSVQSNEVVLVMGAGKSYELARDILNSI